MHKKHHCSSLQATNPIGKGKQSVGARKGKSGGRASVTAVTPEHDRRVADESLASRNTLLARTLFFR